MQSWMYGTIVCVFQTPPIDFSLGQAPKTPGYAGVLARIILKNAVCKPAYPAKNVVFGACLSF